MGGRGRGKRKGEGEGVHTPSAGLGKKEDFRWHIMSQIEGFRVVSGKLEVLPRCGLVVCGLWFVVHCDH